MLIEKDGITYNPAGFPGKTEEEILEIIKAVIDSCKEEVK